MNKHMRFFVLALITRFGFMAGIIGLGLLIYQSTVKKEWVKQTVGIQQSQLIRR